jgi:hypothetical protein
VKVLDFGLAKDAAGAVASSSAEATAGLTRAGTILGTLPYMSPEQVQGRVLGPSSDVFSLGVVLYEMATGERPFRGDNEAALISSILRDAPRTPSAVRSGLPQGLDELVACCLEKDPGRRYSTAGELHTALRKLEEDRGSGLAARVRSSLGASVGKAYRTPLIGREEELAQLREAIARTASGTGALLTLAGEPGVGKTRLATVAMEGLLTIQDGAAWGRGEGVGAPTPDDPVAGVFLQLEKNGERRLDGIYGLNLTVAWSFPIHADRVRGNLRVEGTNVTNEQEQINVNNIGEVARVRGYFQQPTTYCSMFSVSF